MIHLKTAEEIETLAQAGAILASFLDELETMVRPEMTGQDLEDRARDLISSRSVVSSFLGIKGTRGIAYPAVTCISVNESVVHGIPNNRSVREGDIIGIDLGIVYQGMYVDSARTVPVGNITEEASQLISVTRNSLDRGIAAAIIGNTIGDISFAIQSYVEDRSFGVVRDLVGHGVGYAVHEEPQVPNFGKKGAGPKLKEGLIIAIEPMVTIGDPAIMTATDGWTIVTKSGNLAAHFEHTIAVTRKGPRILTASPHA